MTVAENCCTTHGCCSELQAVLQAHPYHIDSLLQLSEVCKMSEDLQMATELIGKLLSGT